jgi:XTP/dITP diphosphohydrolase
VSGRRTIPPGTALLIATRNAHKALEIRQVLPAAFHFLTLDDFPGAPAVVEDGATFAANAAKKASVLAAWLAERGKSSFGSTEFRPTVIGNPQSAIRNPQSRFLYILADDSGLEVDFLGGAPGVHSARFADVASALRAETAANSPDAANNAKLLRLLEGVPPARRTARFRCVLALATLSPSSAEAPIHPEAAFNPQSAIRNPQFPCQPLLFEAVCPGRIAEQPAGAGGFGYDPLFIPEGRTKSFAELGEAVKNTLSHRALALAKLSRYLGELAHSP